MTLINTLRHVSDAAARKTVAAHPSLITDDNTSESEGGGSSDDCGDKDDVRSYTKLSLPTDERQSSLTVSLHLHSSLCCEILLSYVGGLFYENLLRRRNQKF